MIKLKRAYDRPSRDDGVRYLVERLWPRGVKKTELKAHEQSLEPLRKAARRGPVTLVFSSHDTEHNAAVALRDYLKTHAAR